MGVMVPLFLQVAWFSLLMFGCMYTGLEATVTDLCGDDAKDPGEIIIILQSSPTNTFHKQIDISSTNFNCLLYPTHEVNCSWAFQSLEKTANITTTVSICHGGKTVQTLESKTSIGSNSILFEKSVTHLILQFNISLHSQWDVYYYKYESESIEVLPPPLNVQGIFKDSDLLITWDPPVCQIHCGVGSLEYELFINDQEKLKYVKSQLYYTEPNVDPTQSYTVTIRTRIREFYHGSCHWSDWSQPVTIKATFQLNAEVIIAISVGIPMILLALLLVVCQRLSKRLFPPIPSPAPRYMHVLQNNDHLVSPNLVVNSDAEITLVFYSENEKTHKSI
ncbi:hypothetical protein NQD34_012828 [Periophthalmus magnuspinnatus]|nr:hypothetical protein NQD34_012828 [Periophthalmus magnuspinnatus]